MCVYLINLHRRKILLSQHLYAVTVCVTHYSQDCLRSIKFKRAKHHYAFTESYSDFKANRVTIVTQKELT